MNRFSRIRHHVDMKDVRDMHLVNPKMDLQKIQEEKNKRR